MELNLKMGSQAAQKLSIDFKARNTITKIKHKIAVISGKGGVGKSTISANLAVAFAKQGYKVGLIDADITGPNIPLLMGIEGKMVTVKVDGDVKKLVPIETYGVKVMSMDLLMSEKVPVIWRGSIKTGVIKQFLGDVDWGELDVLIVDLPPGTSDEPLTIAQVIPDLTGFVIVGTPQKVAVMDVDKAIKFAQKVEQPVLGIIENMSGVICPHCGKEFDLFKKGNLKTLAKELGIPFLGAIPLEPRVVELSDEGIPAATAEDTKFKAIFEEIVKKLSKEIGL